MADKKIPDDVFENRCRWCHHGRVENGNNAIPEDHLFSARYHSILPCNIMGISQCDKIPGECLSFSVFWMFGICGTCYYNNSFHDGFCTRADGPENKRVVFLGSNYASDGYWTHYRSTCDKYKVEHSMKDRIMRNVLAGKAPANFDPDTWEPLEEMAGTPQAAEWERLQEQARVEREKAAAEAEAKREQATSKAKAKRPRTEPDEGQQMQLWD